MSDSSTSVAATAPRFRISRIRRQGWLASGLAVLLSLVGMALCWSNPRIAAPLKPGLDFTGGTQVEIQRSCSGADCAGLKAAEVRQQLRMLTLPEVGGQAAPGMDRGWAKPVFSWDRQSRP